MLAGWVLTAFVVTRVVTSMYTYTTIHMPLHIYTLPTPNIHTHTIYHPHTMLYIYTKSYIYSTLCQAYSIYTCHTIPHIPSHTHICLYQMHTCTHTNNNISHTYTNWRNTRNIQEKQEKQTSLLFYTLLFYTHTKEIQDLTIHVLHIQSHTHFHPYQAQNTHKHNWATCYIFDLISNPLSPFHCT